jgi:putative solute:sodium symporter small subunit
MARHKSNTDESSRERNGQADSAMGFASNSTPVHWERTRRLTGILLAIWFCVTFGVIFFARELSHLTLFGWPVSYYMAAQGATIVYVILVGFYAWRMRRLDRAWARENAGVGQRDNHDAP